MRPISVFLGLTLAAMAFAPTAGAQRVVGRWNLGENDPGAADGAAGAATTLDLAGGRHLTRYGSPAYSTNTPGAGSSLCMRFHGNTTPNEAYQTSRGDLWDGFDLNNWRLSCHVKWLGNAGQGFSFPVSLGSNLGGGGSISILEAGTWTIHFGGTASQPGMVAVVSNQWVRLDLYRTNGFINLFVDGVLSASRADSPGTIDTYFTIGGHENGSHVAGAIDGRFDGFIDSVVLEDLSLAPLPTVVADLGADFRPNAPKAGWAYLQSTAATGGTETALTYGRAVGNNGNIGYGGNANGFNLAAVMGTNAGGSEFKMFVDGQYNAGVLGKDLLVHPGDPAELGGGGSPFVILRYTLAAADLASGNLAIVSGSFRELIPGGDSVEAFVFRNKTELFHAVASADTLPEALGRFEVRSVVSAGDTISFVVGIKGNLYGDETAVRATITTSSDDTPPALAGPPLQVDTTRLTLTFNEPVNASQTNFALDRGAAIESFAAGAAPNSFELVTTPLVAGQSYVLAIAGVTDLSGNATFTNVSFTAVDFSPSLLAALRPPPEPMGPATRRGPFVISEIMYHPTNRADSLNLEFVEIYNSQPWAEDLDGFRLAGEYDFLFPPGTTIPALGYLVVAASPADIVAAYGIANVLGGFTNRLNNGGGTLRLRDNANAIVFEVSYQPQPPWPVAADGAGHSLVLARPSYGMAQPRAWEASRNPGGSPGTAEPAVPDRFPVVINEFLANGDAVPDFIELFNLSSQEVALDGCALSDEAATNKFVFPAGAAIAARGHLALDESQLGFALRASGETIFFRDPAGRVLDAVRFDGQQRGVSTGRTPDGAPLFSRLSARTPGASNALPLIPEVVLNEVFYSPPSGDRAEEFVELMNRSTSPVDVGGWRLRGGASFNVPAGTVIPAGGYLVIAADVNRLLGLHPSLDPGGVVGGFSGSLANGGDRVALYASQLDGTNAVHYLLSEVAYGRGGRWGRWSDAGGSSLELVDAEADPRLAPSWADSDSSARSGWKTIEFTGMIDNGQGTPDRLQIFLQGEGECLIDDVEVLLAGNSANRLANAGFENGTNGWSLQGTHRLSTVDDAGGCGGPRCLHIRATGRGDTGPNKVQAALTTPFSAGQTATLRAKVRWLAGNPEILLRLRGSWLEACGNILATSDFGTPGRANSRALTNAGPAVTEVAHLPALPAAFAPVTVYARVADPQGVASVRLRYRLDPSSAVAVATMEPIGAGLYAGTIPGQPAGVLAAFHIVAADALGAESIYPTAAPLRECLVRWGENLPAGDIGTYRFWFTQTNRARWETREPQSNETLDATFVYGNWRVIYNAGVMYSGSPFHTPLNTGPLGVPCDYQLVMPGDDLMLGETDIILAPPGSPWGADLSLLDYTMIREQIIWWIARKIGVPSLHRRFVRLFVNGQLRNTIFEDTQQPSGEFVREWFAGNTGGELFKGQDWVEFPDTGNTFLSDVRATLEKFVTAGGTLPPKRYRWIWAPRAVKSSANDFTNFFTLVETMALPETNLFAAQVDALIDIESWFGAMAVQRIAGNWDTWGWVFGKNMYLYKPPAGRWAMIPWDIDFSFGLNSSGTDADLMTNGNGSSQPGDPVSTKMRNHPMLQRAYWRAFAEAVDGPMEDSRVASRIDSVQAGLAANGFSPASPAGVKSWIGARRAYIRGQLAAKTNAVFAITSNGGSDFTTNASVVRLSGTAPVCAKTILVNGASFPVTWTSVTAWTMLVPLASGSNALSLTAVDRHGSLLGNLSDRITVVANSSPPSPVGQVVIDEIMYNPLTPDTAFVEFFNRGTNTFDLSGWILDGAGYTFPDGSLLTNGQYLVLASHRYAFGNAYGAAAVVAGEFSGRLNNQGEVLSLLQPVGVDQPPIVVDRVRYEASAPWPTGANGTGQSLQLVDASADNARVSNWAVGGGWRSFAVTGAASTSRLSLFFDSVGGDIFLDDLVLVPGSVPGVGLNCIVNGDFEAPLNSPWVVSGISTNSHLTNGVAHSGNCSLHLVQNAGAASTTLLYQEVNPRVVTNSTYTLSGWYLAGSGANTNFTLRVGAGLQAKPNLRPFGPTPGMANANAGSIPVYPMVWLNEVVPSNANGIVDGSGHRQPWVELHNAGSDDVKLDGMFLADDYAHLGQWAFPSNITIPAGGFLMTWCDGQPGESSASELHTNFRLTPGTGTVVLSRTVDGTPQILDYLNYASVPPDWSYGSVPDGQPFYRRNLFYATPGGTNIGLAPPLTVLINEWMASNTGILLDPADGEADDWFELYNAGSTPADLSGCYLTDNLTNRFQFEIPKNGQYTIAPNGYLLVWADGQPNRNATNQPDLHVNFNLRAAGEAIGLFAADGTLIDAVTFGQQTNNASMGRQPDGSTNIVYLPQATPRGANVGTDPGLRFLDVSVSGPSVMLTFGSQAGQTYRIQFKDDLGAITWTDLPGDIIASGPISSKTDTPGTLQRFYRVRLLP